jgi:hypothetical protein
MQGILFQRNRGHYLPIPAAWDRKHDRRVVDEEIRGLDIQNKQKAKGGLESGTLDVFSIVMHD